MISKKFKIVSALLVSSFVGAAALFALNGSAISMSTTADSEKTVWLYNADLAKFKTSETGAYRLHPITFGGNVDYSFRIPLEGGKYMNGLLLCGDCGNQTITNLGNFVTSRVAISDGGHDADYFNYNLVLGCKGLKSAQMNVTLQFANGHTGCHIILNITSSESVVGDNLIVDDHHEANLPTNISRDAKSFYSYLCGYDTETPGLSSDRLDQDMSGTEDQSNANSVIFRINGYMTKDIPVNSVSVTINSLMVRYSC